MEVLSFPEFGWCAPYACGFTCSAGVHAATRAGHEERPCALAEAMQTCSSRDSVQWAQPLATDAQQRCTTLGDSMAPSSISSWALHGCCCHPHRGQSVRDGATKCNPDSTAPLRHAAPLLDCGAALVDCGAAGQGVSLHLGPVWKRRAQATSTLMTEQSLQPRPARRVRAMRGRSVTLAAAPQLQLALWPSSGTA